MCGIEAAKITLEELLIVICVSGVFWLTLVQLNIFLLAESVIEACVWHTQSVWHWKLFIRGSSWTCWGCCAWTVSYAVFLRTVLLFSVVCDLLLLSCWVVSDSVAPWTAACQASMFFTISQSLLKLMSIESVMPSNHLILCLPLLLPSIFPSIKVFFPVSWLFASGGQSIGAPASVLPMNVQLDFL